MKPKFSCDCEHCQNACKTKPGWFLPGEAEKAAKLLGMEMQEFFDKYLGVDWWVDYPEDIYVLAPQVTRGEAGYMYSGNPSGQCMLYQDGKCLIHDEKPYECAVLDHTQADISKRHQWVAEQWKEHQEYLAELLGQTPYSEESGLGFSMGWW